MQRPASGNEFIAGRDIPQEWWDVFKSPKLDALHQGRARQQSQSAIGTGDTARQPAGRLRPGSEVLSAAAGQFQPDAPADLRRAVAGASERRQSTSILSPRSSRSLIRSTFGASTGAKSNRFRRLPTFSAFKSKRPISRWHQTLRSRPSPRPRCGNRSMPPTN